MHARMFWSLAMIIASLAATGGTTPAWAWGGGRAEARGAGHAGVCGDRQPCREGPSGYGGPGSVWPYLGATEPATATPVAPEVVVVGGAPQAGGVPAPAAMDFGYVPGCRAIPNGYHCDPPRRGGQAN